MISEQELDAIIRRPRGEISLSKQTKHTPYECYVAWGGWKYMEPNRMLKIIDRMIAAENKMRFHEIEKMKEIRSNLIKIINGTLS